MHAKLLSLALTLTLSACAQAAPAETSTVWVTVPCPESTEQQEQPASTPTPTTTPEENAPHMHTKWITSYYTTFTVTAGGDQPVSTESTVPLSRGSGDDDDDDRHALTVTVHPTETDFLVETRTTTITTTTGGNVEKRSVKDAAATPVLFYPTDLVKSRSLFPAPSIEYLKSVPEPILALVPTMVVAPEPSNTTERSSIASTSTSTSSSQSGLAREISIPTGIRKQDGHYE